MGKSATKRNKKVDQNKENITAQKQTTPKFQKSTAFKNVNERDEDDNTSWRISNILPDINWYPEKSKSVKNEIGCDLMARYPLSVKAMTFMLQNDIKIPKLNTLQRRSLFRYPSSEEKEVMEKKEMDPDELEEFDRKTQEQIREYEKDLIENPNTEKQRVVNKKIEKKFDFDKSNHRTK